MTNSILNGKIPHTLADYSDSIGFIVWHSIADIRVSEAEIKNLANQYGIMNPPKLGHPADAFRRATSTVQVRDEDTKTRYLMRPVSDNAESVVREIVVERVDSKGKKLAHYGATQITYIKATDSIEIEDISGMKAYFHERETCTRLANEAVNRFNEFRNSLTGKELTRFAQSQLERMSYIMLRPNGGCYFVLAHHRESVEALMSFFARLAQFKVSTDPIIFSAAPVPNDPMQKAQIATGVDITIGSEIDQLIARLADMRDNIGSIRESTLSGKVAEITELRSKAESYAQAIQLETGIMEARFEILDKTIDALFEAHAQEQAKKARKGKKSA